jgi:hypothetical protein
MLRGENLEQKFYCRNLKVSIVIEAGNDGLLIRLAVNGDWVGWYR